MFATRFVHFFLVTVCTLVLVLSNFTSIYAGTITTNVIEDKGLFQPGLYVDIESLYVSFLTDDISLICVHKNEETWFLPLGPPVRMYNIYAESWEIPQPVDLNLEIDFFWFIAADTGAGIGPLPDGAELQEASLFGNLTGTEFMAEIIPINDLTNLPQSSTNNMNITWDLSALSDTTGNFFLAKATMPGAECIPEPSTMLLLGSGLIGLAGLSRKKFKKS